MLNEALYIVSLTLALTSFGAFGFAFVKGSKIRSQLRRQGHRFTRVLPLSFLNLPDDDAQLARDYRLAVRANQLGVTSTLALVFIFAAIVIASMNTYVVTKTP